MHCAFWTRTLDPGGPDFSCVPIIGFQQTYYCLLRRMTSTVVIGYKSEEVHYYGRGSVSRVLENHELESRPYESL